MQARMERTALARGGEHDGESITCMSYGYTIDARQVWWIPETQETFLYSAGRGSSGPTYTPYDGPIIHGSGYTF